PDMAMFLFTDAIVKGNIVKVFNEGKMERDFTYIEDIVDGVVRILEKDTKERLAGNENYKLYNIGNNRPVKLLDFIEALENQLGVPAKRQLLPMQPGDVEKTWANVDDLANDYGYSPNTSIDKGISAFIDWYKKYYNVK